MSRTIKLPPLVIDDDDPRPNAYYLARWLGIRQADIAVIAGVGGPFVNQILTGYRRPTQKVIDATVEAFGGRYTADELFDLDVSA